MAHTPDELPVDLDVIEEVLADGMEARTGGSEVARTMWMPASRRPAQGRLGGIEFAGKCVFTDLEFQLIERSPVSSITSKDTADQSRVAELESRQLS